MRRRKPLYPHTIAFRCSHYLADLLDELADEQNRCASDLAREAIISLLQQHKAT
jgi:predicted transcriptional regulator